MGITTHIGEQDLAVGGSGAGAEDESTHVLGLWRMWGDCTSDVDWAWRHGNEVEAVPVFNGTFRITLGVKSQPIDFMYISND